MRECVKRKGERTSEWGNESLSVRERENARERETTSSEREVEWERAIA